MLYEVITNKDEIRQKYDEILESLYEEKKDAALEQAYATMGVLAKFNITGWSKGGSAGAGRRVARRPDCGEGQSLQRAGWRRTDDPRDHGGGQCRARRVAGEVPRGARRAGRNNFV